MILTLEEIGKELDREMTDVYYKLCERMSEVFEDYFDNQGIECSSNYGADHLIVTREDTNETILTVDIEKGITIEYDGQTIMYEENLLYFTMYFAREMRRTFDEIESIRFGE